VECLTRELLPGLRRLKGGVCRTEKQEGNKKRGKRCYVISWESRVER
jgi:hypothetical protein